MYVTGRERGLFGLKTAFAGQNPSKLVIFVTLFVTFVIIYIIYVTIQ